MKIETVEFFLDMAREKEKEAAEKYYARKEGGTAEALARNEWRGWMRLRVDLKQELNKLEAAAK